MSEGFVQSVEAAQPPDSGVRVGVVLEIGPLVVSLQGGRLVNVGVIHSYTPVVGDTVILLRQDDTWCALGVPRPPEDT